MNKSSRDLVAGVIVPWVITGAIAIGGAGYFSHLSEATTTQQVTIAEQAANVAALTASNADIQKRLDQCLKTADLYRGYVEDNKALMQAIIDKWGQNYNTPTKDAIVALDSATAQFKCS